MSSKAFDCLLCGWVASFFDWFLRLYHGYRRLVSGIIASLWWDFSVPNMQCRFHVLSPAFFTR